MRRVLVLSHTYLQPAHRGKLRALAARGLEVTVAIPQRWREPWFGQPIDVAWERQGGLEVFPLPAHGMGNKGEIAKATYGRRALKALLRDRRPDLVQIEEEPSTPAARQVFSAARRLVIPELIGDAGIVVPDGDLPALAGAVERLTDQATRRALAAAARARALRLYSDDAIAERTLSFWQQIVK